MEGPSSKNHKKSQEKGQFPELSQLQRVPRQERKTRRDRYVRIILWRKESTEVDDGLEVWSIDEHTFSFKGGS